MKAVLILFLIVMCLENSTSQTRGEKPLFFSASVGTVWMQSGRFNEVCNTRLLPHFGGGVGLAISDKWYLYARFAYNSQKGTIAYYDPSPIGGSSSIRYADVTFDELVVDGGLEVVAITTQALDFGLIIGLAYVHVGEGALSLAAKSVDALGGRGSFFVELPFETIGSSLSLEAGVLFTLSASTYSANEFGGYDASLTYRVYFGK